MAESLKISAIIVYQNCNKSENQMNLLIFNIGSSTVKYAVFSDLELKLKGIIEKIKDNAGYITAINHISRLLKNKNIKIDAIGHRIVHGGTIRESKVINNRLIKIIEKYSEFAPLHNPPELIGIEYCKKIFNCKQIAVFDTAFFSQLPMKSYIYGLPYKYYLKYGIRRYGFHGISHNYVCIKASEILKKDFKNLKMITCHLGNGCSISAIDNGVCIDTSMGLTPLEGLVMGTRTGDVDVGAVLHLMEKENFSIKELREILNKKSGLLGISGISRDFRTLLKSKNKHAKLALDIFAYRITKYIGAYITALNGADAIVFTGGIGENSPELREMVLQNLEFVGLRLDKSKNYENAEIITRKDSIIISLAIKTNEELMIAKEVTHLINKAS